MNIDRGTKVLTYHKHLVLFFTRFSF